MNRIMRYRFLLINSFLFSVLLIFQTGFGQAKRGLPIGGWRQHTPYTNSFSVAKMGSRIYAASPSGIFFLDTLDGSLGVLNKVNGLYGTGLTCMQKHPDKDLIMIGYEDGTINLLKNNNIFTLKDISNSNLIIGSKRINRIKFYKNEALVCTNFGIVIFNLDKQEVKESNINLGDNGGVIRVLDAGRFLNHYYVITQKGLMGIPADKDFKNPTLWMLYGGETGLPFDPSVYRGLDSLQGKLIIYTTAGFHTKNEGEFIFPRIVEFQTPDKQNLRFINNEFFIASQQDILVFDQNLAFKRVQKNNFITRPSDCLWSGGHLWVSDQLAGLVKLAGEENAEVFLPNAPVDPYCFSLGQFKDKIISNFGGYTWGTALNKNRNTNGFAIFENNEWRSFNKRIDAKVPDVDDIVASKFNPQDQTLYFASYGYGIMLKKDDTYSFYKDKNSGGALCNVIFPNCLYNPSVAIDSFYIRIADLDFDLSGNLWAVNGLANQQPPDSAIAWRELSSGRWRRIKLNVVNAKTPVGVTVDRNNYKWIRMAPGVNNSNAGIVIINGDASKQVVLNNQSNQGNLPSSDVYAIKEDKQGYIWVGTQKGLAVYYNPFNAFYSGGISASTPIYPPAAGRPVLENDLITSIEIDGGNRKWVGTKENGLWLFNPDITEVIHHFTKENSPLLSNFVYSLAINKPTGELFIATENGLISYQTDASENVDADGRLAADDCGNQDVSIFPNPVERGYDGLITIRGVASNSTVKILTPSGKLVFQTTAVGGMATWNGQTYDGKRVNPGMYVVISSDPEGGSNCISKLAILE